MKRHLILAGLFILALPLFMWVQWSPDAFVHERLKAANLDHAFRYEHIETAWYPGVHVHGATVRTEGGVELSLGDVWLMPAWREIFQANPGVHICGEWEQKGYSLNVLLADDGVRLRDIDVELEGSSLKDLVKAVAMGMDVLPQGMLHLQGGIDLTTSGEPMWADASLVWNASGIDLGGQQSYELGDFVLTLKSDDTWRWSLQGEGQLAASGSGTLMPAGADLGNWGLRGEVQLIAEGMAGNLMAALSGGSKQAVLLLTGSLANPRVQWRK